MGEVKLTEKRRAALTQAASPEGLAWFRGDTNKSATCNWLFKTGLVEWGWREGVRVLVATDAGRAALPPSETPDAQL